MNVELVYDAGCPNVAAARRALLQAFAAAGVAPSWREWERADPAAPAHVRAYGSPTVLIDGRDVAPAAAVHEAACRLYADAAGRRMGAPPVERITQALRGADVAATTRRRALWGSGSLVGVALLPKLMCVVCWPVYAAVLGAFGIVAVEDAPWAWPLAAALAIIGVGWGVRVWRLRRACAGCR